MRFSPLSGNFMSRIGENPITIPNGVEVEITGQTISVKGPKGNLEQPFHTSIKVEKEGDTILVKRKRGNQLAKSMHGLTRTLINNMVVGVTDGWSKNLEMVGVGYRVQGGADMITLSVGFSHSVEFKAVDGITFAVADTNKIAVSGIDKALVGQVAANIRAIKPPEVYKGKGIRYQGEYVRRKPGKAGKGAAK